MLTAYGKVTEIEATVPPPSVEPPPEIPLGETRRGRATREGASAREGEEEPKTWVHVHIVLDPPHSGEIEVNTPEVNVSGMLVVDGRARVILESL